MKKQRLIALMCASIVTAASLAGCGNSDKTKEKPYSVDDLYSKHYVGIEDVYIVLEQNDVDVLHKGNMGVLKYTTDYNYSFNCGQGTVSNATHACFSEMPSEYHYDKICEDCFRK